MKFMWAKEPAIAKKWTEKYGSKPRKKGGLINKKKGGITNAKGRS